MIEIWLNVYIYDSCLLVPARPYSRLLVPACVVITILPPKTGNIVVILRGVVVLILGEQRWEKKGKKKVG